MFLLHLVTTSLFAVISSCLSSVSACWICPLLLNSGPAKPDVALTSHVGWVGVTLCSSGLDQAKDKFYTVLERRQIGHEDPAIKIQLFHHRSQELPVCLQKDTYGWPDLSLSMCKLQNSVMYQIEYDLGEKAYGWVKNTYECYSWSQEPHL